MIEQATKEQIRKFFALIRKLGIDVEKAKDRAKERYNLESFTDIKTSQLSPLIDMLEDEINKKSIPHKLLDEEVDNAIVASGFELSICIFCGEDCVVDETGLKAPCCGRLKCVRELFQGKG